ncbi:nucleoside-diphosphate kinase [Coxiella endosymbiont of Amblyomma americanum]|uniref:nucleoside-diphosphate kinase n=1 Tax=Coxiella endosymbiont of Amblyomma americanum TaxID=325775 RepID=UPI00057F1FCB|nr:nucleoside-diphosphate kinase [Coxiella endosymbiont of Amblyomma americanum]AJC50519.1 nucleoside diphosphate kinase [Coxiella endosymbiont of Amblyomma americanum]AUJ58853.1 nucleoside-diphosphate kinase [Coxiella-like endosymbiont of Amblyomma americanum]
MSIEQTLSIIKPDAVAKGIVGEIYKRFEQAHLRIIAVKMQYLNEEQAKRFYIVHKSKAFYKELIRFMTQGPILVQVLEGESAIIKNRKLMGATDPKEAEPGTIRADFADSINKNVIHGSDSHKTAREEIAFFFKPEEIFSSNS